MSEKDREKEGEREKEREKQRESEREKEGSRKILLTRVALHAKSLTIWVSKGAASNRVERCMQGPSRFGLAKELLRIVLAIGTILQKDLIDQGSIACNFPYDLS